MLPVYAQAPAEAEGLKAQVKELQNDVESLKKNQTAIIQQLNAIRDYLVRQNKPQNPVIDVSGAPVQGRDTAKIAVVEYTDYWCGFCGRFARSTYPEIVKKYVDTGKVRYYIKDFAAQRGPKVAEAAHCAGEQGKYWPMHAKLFANVGKYSDNELQGYVKEIGGDAAAWKTCFESGKYAKRVQAGMESGSAAGVDGTPTFMIGTVDPAAPDKVKTVRTLVGAQPMDAFEAALDEVLASAAK